MADTINHDEIVQRCCSSIRSRFSIVNQPRALRRLKSEINIVQQRGFMPLLREVLELSERLTECCLSFRLIGSGCSSFVNYLLGLSEFNPVRFRLPYQRFWTTKEGNVRTFTFVVDPNDTDIPESSSGIKIHGMTPTELIPYRLKTIEVPDFDKATFEMLAQGDTSGVFQLENDAVRDVAVRFRPTTVRDLATVTALALRESSDPELAAEFLEHRSINRSGNNPTASQSPVPLLFQEELMTVLNQRTTLSLSEAYFFTRESAKKGGLPVDHPLYEKALKGATSKGQNADQAQRLVKTLEWESRSAVCLAHHLSNAITTYRAAYLKRHYPTRFERLLEEIEAEV